MKRVLIKESLNDFFFSFVSLVSQPICEGLNGHLEARRLNEGSVTVVKCRRNVSPSKKICFINIDRLSISTNIDQIKKG